MDILLIKPKWAELILEGIKTWEIRGSNTKKRGDIQIAKSGTSKIYGMVTLLDSIELNEDLWKENQALHKVNLSWEDLKKIYKRPHAWVFNNARIYKEPISYKHPSGAVIWVKDENVR